MLIFKSEHRLSQVHLSFYGTEGLLGFSVNSLSSSSMVSLFGLCAGWASTFCVPVVALAGAWGLSVSLEELVGVGLQVLTRDMSWAAPGRFAWSES